MLLIRTLFLDSKEKTRIKKVCISHRTRIVDRNNK
jgi:hypothetical protein